MVRKDKTAVYVFVALVLAFVGIYFAGLTNSNNQPFATVPIDDFGKTSASPFQCPGDVSLCKVQGVCVANNKKSEPKVIFRTNANTFADYNNAGSWISLYCVPSNGVCADLQGGLIGYCNTGSQISIGSNAESQQPFFTTPQGNALRIYNGNLIVKTGSYYKEYSSNSCTIADVSPTPREPYTSNNQEKTTGDVNSFNGQALFSISGTTSLSKVISYSASTNGTATTPIYDVQTGDTATISGCDESYIKYGTYEIYDSCSVNQCNSENTGFKNCTNGRLSESITYCDLANGEVCSNGNCQPPFQITKVEFSDISGKVKTSFTPSEKVYIKSVFTSTKVSSGNVKFIIYKGVQKVQEVTKNSYNFLDGKANLIEITNPTNTGDYHVEVEIPTSTTLVKFGSNEEYKFRIALLLKLVSSIPYSEKTGTSLFTGSPIFIDLKAYDENDQKLLYVDTINLEVKFNGVIIQNPQFSQIDNVYRFAFVFNQPGLLQVKATLGLLGIVSNEVNFDQLSINNPTIITKITNLALIRTVTPGSTKTIYFETKDSFENYIETSNIVKIVPPGASTGSGDIDVSSSVTGSNGKYQFDYTFTDVGSYTINLISSAPGFPASTQPLVGTITVDPNTIDKECIFDGDCEYGEKCSNYKCVPDTGIPIVIYLIIGGVVLLIVLVVLIKISRKKSSQSIDLGGI